MGIALPIRRPPDRLSRNVSRSITRPVHRPAAATYERVSAGDEDRRGVASSRLGLRPDAVQKIPTVAHRRVALGDDRLGRRALAGQRLVGAFNRAIASATVSWSGLMGSNDSRTRSASLQVA